MVSIVCRITVMSSFQALIHLEDQLAEEKKDARDEMQQLKNTTRQLQAQLKNHQERGSCTDRSAI